MRVLEHRLLLAVWMTVMSAAVGKLYLDQVHAPKQAQTEQANVVGRALHAVVRVQTEVGTGAGSVIDGRGFVLTCAHVIAGSKTGVVEVLFYQQEQPVPGLVVWADTARDLAIVRVRPRDMPKSVQVLALADGDPAVGERVYTIGHPKLQYWTVGEGIVSKYSPERGGLVLEQTTALMHPGNSGGPLINVEGKLVGVSSRVYADNPFMYVPMFMNFAVSLGTVKDFLDEVNDITTFRVESY